MAELQATRVAFLELKDEQRLVQEGYALLDEKRILLAAEIRRQLIQLHALRAEFRTLEQTALETMIAAVSHHGLEELSVYPPLTVADDRVHVRRSRLLGIELLDARLETSTPKESEAAVNPSPEARACAAAHRALLPRVAQLAACCLNLRRLVREYVRTERRARSIENVLLPEIDAGLKFIGEQLESTDQEEVARLRHRRMSSRESAQRGR